MEKKKFSIIKNQGTIQGEDWILSNNAYLNLEEVHDPSEFSKPITSIPTPFARLTLIKSAFKFVSENFNSKKSNNGIGETIYHKLVAEWFDVAEIFYNFNLLREDKNLNIIRIPFNLTEIKKINNIPLSDALATDYNLESNVWSNFDEFYIIKYKGIVVGSTSPYTIYCSADYNNSMWSEDEGILGHSTSTYRYFDNKYEPLHKRKEEFILYLYSFVEENLNNFSPHMKYILSYLNKTKEEYILKNNKELYEKIRNSSPLSINEKYHVLQLDGNDVSVKSILLYTFDQSKTNNIEGCSFFIVSDLVKSGKLKNIPLVLPSYRVTGSTYINKELWNGDWRAPLFSEEEDINNRRLPYRETFKYPYLTVSDLLEPCLIELPIKHSKNFLFPKSKNNTTYLLPIKKIFFNYFSREDLIRMIEKIVIEEITSKAIKFTIEINTDKGSVKLERVYQRNTPFDIKNNKGTLIELTPFTFSAMPLVNFKKIFKEDSINVPLNIFYNCKSDIKFNLLNSENLNQESLTPRESFKDIDSKNIAKRNEFKALRFENPVFDLFSITINDCREFGISETATGLILPILPEPSNNTSYKFAIDFGTSNTHIEYTIDNSSNTKPLETDETNPLVISLHERQFNEIDDPLLRDFEKQEGIAFLPKILGGNPLVNKKMIRFPQRSVLAYLDKNLPSGMIYYPPLEYNIPFSYYRTEMKYLKTHTNIKWSADNYIVKIFLENLILLMQAIVITGAGRLADTKIIWTYPTSMGNKINNLSIDWEELYTKYFSESSTNKIIPVNESIAPFYYYLRSGNIDITGHNISIDIGGGTTDIVVFEKEHPKIITSFKFAANSIFGNGYSQIIEENGFFKRFFSTIRENLKTTRNNYDLSHLVTALEELKNSNKPEDMISFFFSLSENEEIKKCDINIDKIYNHEVRKVFSFVFFIFYTSIIYHIANFLNKYNISIPRNIMFSGLGSRVIKSINLPDEKLEYLTKKMIEDILGFKVQGNQQFKIHTPSFPKEITAKGALSSINYPDRPRNVPEEILFIKSTESKDTSYLFQDIGDNIANQTLEEVEKYFKYIENMIIENKELYDALDLSKDKLKSYFSYMERSNDLMKAWLQIGLKNRMNEINSDLNERIPETLFFYPLIGSLFSLASKLSDNKK